MEHHIKISVVIPTYQSAAHIASTLNGLKSVLCGCREACEIIVVDDGSSDSTFQALLEWGRQGREADPIFHSGNTAAPVPASVPVHGPGFRAVEESMSNSLRLRLVRLRENRGQQQATLCGIDRAEGNIIVTIDDDLQHPPAAIPLLVEKVREGNDLVYGIPGERFTRLFRSFGSAARNFLFLCLFGRRAAGIRPTSFRAFRAGIGKDIVSEPEGFLYLSAEFFQRTRKISQVPVRYEHADARHSRYPFSRLFRIFAGIVLYAPFLPRKCRERAGGAAWHIRETKEVRIQCGC